jgi:hypothetical protein
MVVQFNQNLSPSQYLLLSWTGGIPTYQVQMATNLSAVAWQDFGSATSGTSLLITPTNNAAFYRIPGQ